MYRSVLAVSVAIVLVAGSTIGSAQGSKKNYPKDKWVEHRTSLGQCLINHAASQSLDKLLTKAMAMEVMSSSTEPTVSYTTKYIPTGYQMASYAWPGTRKKEMTIMKQTIEVVIDDEVAFGMVRQMNPEYFDRSYRTPTEEDKQKMREEMAKALDTSSIASTETHKEAGSSLVEGMMDGMAFEPVDGVGDDAAWDIKDSALIVQTGDVVFNVKVDVEHDWRSNMKRAIPLAQRIIASCQ